MKLQHAAIFFVIIFLPIMLVTSYFISLQVNTVRLETSYDSKLLNATYDAMTAFELNTANEDLSSVSDSLRSIIDASNNIFFNTLCTNLGISNASKSYVQPYIPAILYTLYDGYYIYSPTNIPEICVDKYGNTIRTSSYGVSFKGTTSYKGKTVGIYSFNQDDITSYVETSPDAGTQVNYNTFRSNGIEEEYDQILYKNREKTGSVDSDGREVYYYSTQLHTTSSSSTYYKRDYILKSYIPYAARYLKNATASTPEIDVTVNYTLDNYMTIEGNIGGIYYTKSGYLTDSSLISSIEVKKGANGGSVEWTQTINSGNWTKFSEEVLNQYIEDSSNYEIIVNLNDGISISNRYGAVQVTSESGSGMETKYWEDAKSAVKYYVDSYIFSSWVHENLSGLQAQNLKNTQYSVKDIQDVAAVVEDDKVKKITDLEDQILFDFSGDTSYPFAVNNNDPESDESFFYTHKRNVIKNSITFNLVLSMLVYTEESRTVEYNMPVFSEVEWDRILNNVSITAFMEGMKCGLKYYNNYAIVTSTNNEISVDENEIYYVPRADKTDSYGRFTLNSIERKDKIAANQIETAHRIDCEDLVLNGNGAISFKSKEIKYDKILDSSGRYLYDHMAYTDYDCIVDSNYTVKNANGSKEDGNTEVLKYLLKNATATTGDTAIIDQAKFKLKAYRIAIAKERNNLYKTTSFVENYGWETVYFGDKNSGEKKNSGSITVNLGLTNTDLKKIKKIEVTIEDAKITNGSNAVYGVYTDEVEASFGGQKYSEKQTISTTSSSRRTLEFSQDFDSGDASQLTLKTGDNRTKFVVEAVKVYYK